MKNIFYFIILLTLPLSAQEYTPDNDLNSNIQELSDFHEVIYQVWHTGYASKDYKVLRDAVPEVNSGAEKIYNAALPGILRDKQKKWDETLAGFKKSVEGYDSAAAGDNDEALLTAAEVLHTYYELLVRCVRPVLPEVDDFHKSLYVIYHKYYPQKNYNSIKEMSDELISKAVKIRDAKLPARLIDKNDSFKAAANNLYHSSMSLKEALYSNNSVLIDSAVEKLHSDYQKVEAVFD